MIRTTPEASGAAASAAADLRVITSAVHGGFTTPAAIAQAEAAIGRLQSTLPALRRHLRAMRSGLRLVGDGR